MLFRDSRPSGVLLSSRTESPKQLEALSVPSDHGCWLNEEQKRLPIRPELGKDDPEQTIWILDIAFELFGFDSSHVDRDLLSKGKVLKEQFSLQIDEEASG